MYITGRIRGRLSLKELGQLAGGIHHNAVRETIKTVDGMETSRGQQVREAHGGTDRACATPWKAMPTLSFPQGWVAPSHF